MDDLAIKKLKNFRSSIDKDEGLQSKRKILVLLCIIFLALNITGATIEEANTFIFKIKFTNEQGLGYFFVAAIVFMTMRYYSYAQDYHSKLYDYWSERMLADYRVFCYDPNEDECVGFIGRAVNIYHGDEPGILEPKYCVRGFFRRSISYRGYENDENGQKYSFTKYAHLTKFHSKWNFKGYLSLLWFEAKYQVESIIKYRESLDLLAPYLLSLTAIISFCFKAEILKLMRIGI